MAIGAGTVFQIQSTATAGNVNAGAFNPGNANGITDGVIASGTGNTPTLSSATYTFVAGDVGHWIFFPAQANIVSGWYQIASQSAGVATLSAAIGQAQIVSNYRFGTNTSAGCATTAAPTGVTYLVDYSQTDSSRYTSTTMTGATTAATDASGNPFTAQMVGNFICMASGTGVTVGWYEILSISGGTATLSSSAGTTYSAVHAKIGGAVSLGGATAGITDNNFFTLAIATANVAAGRYFIKGNATYTLSAAVTTSAGTPTFPIITEGYATTRGDRPTGSTRPILATGANIFSTGTDARLISLQFTGTGTSTIAPGGRSTVINCKVTNSSSTAARNAFGGNAVAVIGCEAISYRGIGILGANNPLIYGCYIHDCDQGISVSTQSEVINCIISGCVTNSIIETGAISTTVTIANNTIYGAENKLGVGITLVQGNGTPVIYNNVLYGLATASSFSATTTQQLTDYNDYFNNTNDVSSAAQWPKGANDIAVNPSFTNVTQVTGSTATTTAGNHLVDSGASFISAGVTAGRDYVYIKSGTGVTAGIYGILSVDSATQITTDITLTANATGDKVYQITCGQNFLPTGSI